MKMNFLKHLIAIGFLFAISEANAFDLVVVDSNVASIQPGKSVDSVKPLALETGQKLTLIAPNGNTYKLRGPFQGMPVPDVGNQGGGVVDSLKNLVANRAAGTSTLGVVRSGPEEKPLPEPWLVDITKSGERCVLEGTRNILWRADFQSALPFKIQPADRSWAAKAVWAAGLEKLAMPDNFTFKDKQTYLVEANGASVSLTIHAVPANVNDNVKAAWMLDKGCQAQAIALVKTLN